MRSLPHLACVAVLLLGAANRPLSAQTSTIHVRVHTAGIPVERARVRADSASAMTDSSGTATLRAAPGPRAVVVRKLGFIPDTISLDVRPGADTTLDFELNPTAAALTGVVVTSTRTERRLEDEPLRVEVLAGDDVTEKNEMRPGDLRTLFREMSGVRVQITSASLGAATVRVQGLRGRYTTVLNDGLPLYGTQASGFGLVQQAPLDLRQVEVIKGAASALYGPSALGGVVNLISRRPPDTSQVVVNQTTTAGSDVLGFVARSLSPRVGVTTLAGAHYQSDVDPDRDNWSDIAGYQRAELRPRLFYSDSAGRRLMITVGGFAERRGGGIVAPTLDPSLRDSLSTRHGDAGATGSWRLSDAWALGTRVAFNDQARDRAFAGAREREDQRTMFGEVTATGTSARNTLVAGASWQEEHYRNRDVPRFDQTLSVPSVFAQHTVVPLRWIAATLNARCDASDAYGTICTPRVSVLARSQNGFNVRASVGNGWFAPLAMNEETEVIGLSRVSLPAPLEAERGRSASVDATVTRGPTQISATVFENRVSRPVRLRRVAGDTTGAVELVNAPGVTRVNGAELFAVYNREPFVATAFYAATRSRELSPESGLPREVPLTPRREAGLDLAIEEDESGAYVAMEVFYTGKQALDDNPYRAVSRPFTTLGFLGSKRIGRTTLFVNVENLTGVRQTRYDPILRSTPGDGGRRTVSAWAPLEGRLVNAGVRYAL